MQFSDSTALLSMTLTSSFLQYRCVCFVQIKFEFLDLIWPESSRSQNGCQISGVRKALLRSDSRGVEAGTKDSIS
ncbi:hypothetical protein M3Y96_00390100 [Aphelenchoides besseyi]|nr:hypothetical protein M3Y96_00390100 [Aphelenchoides besseyi]